MDKLDFKEKVWGFIFGIIAIASAVAEMISGGISWSAFWGMLKDIASTAVVIVVGYAFINSIPKKAKDATGKLETAVLEWGMNNTPLIFKAENLRAPQNSNYTQGYLLLQYPDKYVDLVKGNLNPESPEWLDYATYNGGKKYTGRFLIMPDFDAMTKKPFTVNFSMKQKHFESIASFDENVDIIIKALNARFNDNKVFAKPVGKREFEVSYQPLTTDNDISMFIDSLDFVLSMVKVIM